jgi:uncharacterized protein
MKERLQAALKEALKARNKVRLDTVRSVLSAIQYEAMDKKVEDLPDDQCLGVLQREIKKRREEIEFADQAKREDLKEKLKVEIATLEEFLPQQLSSPELEKVLMDLKAANPALNMSAGMKVLKEKYAGQYDGKMASELAKRILG